MFNLDTSVNLDINNPSFYYSSDDHPGMSNQEYDYVSVKIQLLK